MRSVAARNLVQRRVDSRSSAVPLGMLNIYPEYDWPSKNVPNVLDQHDLRLFESNPSALWLKQGIQQGLGKHTSEMMLKLKMSNAIDKELIKIARRSPKGAAEPADPPTYFAFTKEVDDLMVPDPTYFQDTPKDRHDILWILSASQAQVHSVQHYVGAAIAAAEIDRAIRALPTAGWYRYRRIMNEAEFDYSLKQNMWTCFIITALLGMVMLIFYPPTLTLPPPPAP